jgi:hypothetical protein
VLIPSVTDIGFDSRAPFAFNEDASIIRMDQIADTEPRHHIARADLLVPNALTFTITDFLDIIHRPLLDVK